MELPRQPNQPLRLLVGRFVLLLIALGLVCLTWHGEPVTGGPTTPFSPPADERQDTRQLVESVLPAPFSILPTPTWTPALFPANTEETFDTFQGRSGYQTVPQYQLTYSTQRWQFSGSGLRHRQLGCVLDLAPMPTQYRGPVEETTVQLAGYTWTVRHFLDEWIIGYLLQMHGSYTFLYRTAYPANAGPGEIQQCQAESERVLETFALVTLPPTAVATPASVDWLPYRDPTGVVFDYPAGWFIDRIAETIQLIAPADEITRTTPITGVSILIRPRPVREWQAAYPQVWAMHESPSLGIRNETAYTGAPPRHWLDERLRGWLFVATDPGPKDEWKGEPTYPSPRWGVSYYSVQHEVEIRLFSNVLAEDPLNRWPGAPLTTTVALHYPIFDRIAQSVRIDFTPVGAAPAMPFIKRQLPALPAVLTEPTLTPPPAVASPLTAATLARSTGEQWQPYTDATLGLAFEYPPAWKMEDRGPCYLVVRPADDETSEPWYGTGIGIQAFRLAHPDPYSSPYDWPSNEENYRVHWSSTINVDTVGGIIVIYGGYDGNESYTEGQWKSPPELIGVFFDETSGLTVRLHARFQPEHIQFVQSRGIIDLIEQYYPDFTRLLHSLRFSPPAPPSMQPRLAGVAEWKRLTTPEGVSFVHPADWPIERVGDTWQVRHPDFATTYASDHSVTVSVRSLPRSDKQRANPYGQGVGWGGWTQVYWGVPLQRTGIDGLVYVSGDDNFDGGAICTGQWDSGGTLNAIYYSEAHELLVTFQSNFDDESTLLAHEQGLAEAVHERFRVFDYMIQSVEFPPR
jgi:hypothetical protein